MALTKVGKEGITGISNSSDATAITIDSSEIVMTGKTAANFDTAGFQTASNGQTAVTRASATPFFVNRKTDDGTIIDVRKDNATVGSIGSSSTSGKVFITGGNVGITFTSNGRGHPTNSSGVGLDNSMDWGQSTFRFDDIFATNGTIQTSDQNEKQDIASLTTAEMTAAKAISKLFKTFKWKDKVAAKGDAARTHTGVIAQEVQTAMSDAGLDASKYAFWCSDTWWETSTDVPAVEADEEAGIEAQNAYTRIDTYHTADEAPEGATERTRLGVRYPELLAFVGAATEQRLADIETRLTALEGS